MNQHKPPKFAMAIMRALSGSTLDTDALLGDLEEEFRERAVQKGESAARAWLWKQVVASFGPLVRSRIHAKAVARRMTAAASSTVVVVLVFFTLVALAVTVFSTFPAPAWLGHIAYPASLVVAMSVAAYATTNQWGRRAFEHAVFLGGMATLLILAMFRISPEAESPAMRMCWFAAVGLGVLASMLLRPWRARLQGVG